MTTVFAHSKCQLAVGKSDTQLLVLFSEPMHNLVPAATATLFMSQFCEDRMVGEKVEWCLCNGTVFIRLIPKILFC